MTVYRFVLFNECTTTLWLSDIVLRGGAALVCYCSFHANLKMISGNLHPSASSLYVSEVLLVSTEAS